MPTKLSSTPKTKKEPWPDAWTDEKQDKYIITIWGLVTGMWDLGRKQRALYLKRHALQEKLDDPELKGHPRYEEALEKLAAIDRQRKDNEALADQLIHRVRQVYSQLSPENRNRFVNYPGWPTIGQPDRWAKALWYRARGGDPWPSGEPPF